MKNNLIALFLFAAFPVLANERHTSLGALSIISISVEGSSRAAVVLSGNETSYFRLDCIDRSDELGKRHKNTILVFSKKTPIARMNHQLFTGVQDFYCSGISEALFGGLKYGDNVRIDLLIDSHIDDFRGGTEVVNIKDIIVTVDPSVVLPVQYPHIRRSYKDSGSMLTDFTSREMLD